jgi:hypothetical protein
MRAMALDEYDEFWKDDCIATIIALSLAKESFSSDDVRRELRPPNRSSQIGAAFRSAQSQGLIEAVGYEVSTTATRRNGRHLTWRRKTERGEAAA